MKRILDCYSSDFSHFGREELLYAMANAEGRTIACETICSIQPMLGDVTNAEFAASMGADILLLNDNLEIDTVIAKGKILMREHELLEKGTYEK